jgi:hypothetical protein
MSTKKTEAGTAASAVETKNGNQRHVVTSKASNFGQIGYTLTSELTLDEALERASEGLLHIAQRAPASRVEKLLVGYSKREDMGADWTRDQIAYTDEIARKFETELANEIEKVAHIKVRVTAERYEVEQREPAYAYGKKLVTLANKAGGGAIKRLAANVGYNGKDLSIYNIDFLRAIEEDKRKRDEAMFA